MLEQINKENFQHMLSQFNTGELEGMIEKFPYFQQAHLLLAKKYQQENSPKFDQQLQLAALYVQDRELLYELFNEKNSISAPIVQTTVAEQIKVEEKKEEIEPVIVTAPEVLIVDKPEIEEAPVEEQKTIEGFLQDDIDLKRQIELIEESARRLNEIIEHTIEEPETTRITAPEAVVLDQVEVEEAPFSEQIVIEEIKEDDIDLNRQIELIEESAKRLNQIIENTVEEKPEVLSSQPEADEEEVEALIVAGEEPALIGEAEEQGTEEVTLQEEAALPAFSRIEPHTFDEWLKAFNNKSAPQIEESPVVSEDTPEEEDELTELLTANISVDYLHELVKEETTYAKGLERFIEDQIQKHKQPEVKKPAPETDFKTDPATETMAKVYEMQKKYAKAIKTYEALTLKFPEKSSLFAARITYLKNLV